MGCQEEVLRLGGAEYQTSFPALGRLERACLREGIMVDYSYMRQQSLARRREVPITDQGMQPGGFIALFR